MKESNKISLLSILITGIVVLLATTGAIYILYRTAIDEQKARLFEMVRNEAAMIHVFHEAVSAHGEDMALDTHLDHANELQDFFTYLTRSVAESGSESKHPSLQFFIAEQKEDKVQYYVGLPKLVAKPVPFEKLAGKPMGRALEGESDVLETADHMGIEILCAYTFVESVGIGIVAKILKEDIRRPFLRTGVITYAVSFILVCISGLLIKLTVAPLAHNLEEKRLEVEDINEDLYELATTDHLTGLFNRQYFNTQLSHMLSVTARHENKLSVIIFDIDRFKQVNDTLGHLAGDTVLQELASLVKGSIRESDIFARWGGEEFIILICSAVDQDAECLAEKIRIEVAEYQFSINRQVTCSFGVADHVPGDTLDILVNRADEALYEAKAGGRNMVVKG